MGLAKAEITPEGEAPIQVLFNPTQYNLDNGNQIAEIGIPGLSAPILQYVRGNTRTLSMDLFFDTYEQQDDVRTYTNQIYGLLAINRETHAPPICTFIWGSFNFTCVVERVSGRFTMFLPNGTPVRATLSVTLKEYIEIAALVRGTPTESVDRTKTYTIKRGDTLHSIAAAEYNDPAQWRIIARANTIDNPRVLLPGRVLILPPLR